MAEFSNVVAESETPVNPYSLLEAVNRSSDTANTAWLIFLALMAYLMVAVAGVTHQDFLIEKPVSLPILQVDIQQRQFFQFAPILLVLLHLGVVAQLVLLARKALEFDKAIRLLESSRRRNHPLRLELHNFFFVQAIAGPQRSAVMASFLHGMSWLTLVVLPVVLILYIQVVFLPYHDVAITWTHRVALLFDVAMLVLIGVFLSRAETSFFQAFWNTLAMRPISVFITTSLLTLITIFSLFIATVPEEFMDRVAHRIAGQDIEKQSRWDRHYRGGFLLPFGLLDDKDRVLFGLFRRNLVVTDTDLVVDKDVTPGEPTLNLRGRDLRYARLDRSDLHQADLTGANLDYASLAGTDLRNVWLNCADIDELLLSENREKAFCTSAQRASFKRADLSGANMTALDASDANFEGAKAQNARLTYAILTGGNFASANLQKADLSGEAQAQGANFLDANLQGADFTDAQLQAADFRFAAMQAANFRRAQLQRAILQGANLDAANLMRAKLQGADMSDASITAIDMRWAAIWQAKPPMADPLRLADLSSLDFSVMESDENDALRDGMKRIPIPRVRKRVEETLKPLLQASEGGDWANSKVGFDWRDLQQASFNSRDVTNDYQNKLTNHLNNMMCRARWREGGIATGIARRAQAGNFRGHLAAVYDRLNDSDCKVLPKIPSKIMAEFSSAVDLERATETPPAPPTATANTISPPTSPTPSIGNTAP